MVAQICALHESWDRAKYGFLPQPAERYRSWLIRQAADERAVFIVAESDDQPLVGFLVATIEREIPVYRLEEFAFIHDLWVQPDYRNEGIARQMVMLGAERFAELGVKQIRLDTAAQNDAARALFATCGFRLSSMEMLLELP